MTILSTLGLNKPFGRAAALASVGLATQLLLKPSISYTADGSARPFVLTSSESNTTYVPWWAWPFLGATIGGLFI